MTLTSLAEPGAEHGNFKADRNRRILDLVDSGMTYAEVGAALGIPTAAVNAVMQVFGGRLSANDVAWVDHDAPPQLTDAQRDARAALAALSAKRRDLQLEDGALTEEVERMRALITEADVRRAEIASACAALSASIDMLDQAEG